jgi:hypothetical protein
LKIFSIVKVSNKYVWNWLASFFLNLFLPYMMDIFWLKCEKDEKPQVHFSTPLIQKQIKCNMSFAYNLLKGYKVNCELCLNFNEYIWTYFKHVVLIYFKIYKIEKNVHIIIELNKFLSSIYQSLLDVSCSFATRKMSSLIYYVWTHSINFVKILILRPKHQNLNPKLNASYFGSYLL